MEQSMIAVDDLAEGSPLEACYLLAKYQEPENILDPKVMSCQ